MISQFNVWYQVKIETLRKLNSKLIAYKKQANKITVSFLNKLLMEEKRLKSFQGAWT